MPAMRRRHVVLLVETSNAYARGLLVGVHRYVVQSRTWSLYLAEHSRQETDFSWMEGWRGDGVLARIETAGAAQLVEQLALPTVDLSAGRLLPDLPGVETDDRAIAHAAIQHFVERGLRHLAFCGDARFAWSESRRRFFVTRARDLGIEPHLIDIRTSAMRAVERTMLADWLRELPKPVGVLSCYDIAGQAVLEACHMADIPVPDAVAVLGVDNDEMIANLTSPPLSSVEPNVVRTGFLAASMLDRMMAGQEVEPGLRLIPPLRVVARQSSDILAVDDPDVATALRLIRDNADRDLQVTDVLRAVGLSRRSLDYRFVAAVGRTVSAEITRVRMARVAELLTTTQWTLQRVAERLGFPHAEYMGVAFKRVTGLSPGAYRREMSNALTPRPHWIDGEEGELGDGSIALLEENDRASKRGHR